MKFSECMNNYTIDWDGDLWIVKSASVTIGGYTDIESACEAIIEYEKHQ